MRKARRFVLPNEPPRVGSKVVYKGATWNVVAVLENGEALRLQQCPFGYPEITVSVTRVTSWAGCE